jgi:hypothetical protein
MELQSKKLMQEIKDLDMINDADIDTSELSDSLDLTSAEVGKFQHQAAPNDKEVN